MRTRPWLGHSFVTLGVVLLPRLTSVGAQWLLSAFSDTTAVAQYVSITYRASAACAILASGLGPILAARQRSLSSARVRATVAGALLGLSLLAFTLVFAFETWMRGTAGLGLATVVATFAASIVQQSAAMPAWAVWQRHAAFMTLLIASVTLAGAVLVATMLGRPWLVVLGVGVLGTVPSVAMLGSFRARRAIRYARAIAWRSIPFALPTLGSTLVAAVAVAQAELVLGARRLGVEALYWSVVMALNIASQNRAVATLGNVTEANRPSQARHWLPSALFLVGVGACIHIAFVLVLHHRGASTAPSVTEVWTAAACILSDPISFFFCPRQGRTHLAVGSSVLAGVLLLVLFMQPRFALQLGAFGPVAIIAVGRIAFIPGPGRFLRLSICGALALLGILAVRAS